MILDVTCYILTFSSFSQFKDKKMKNKINY